MADDRMKNDQRNMGGANREDQDYGQQSPGKTGQGQSGQQAGQHAGGQQGGGQFGGQNKSQNMEDDEDLNTGRGQGGGQNLGGQNR